MLLFAPVESDTLPAPRGPPGFKPCVITSHTPNHRSSTAYRQLEECRYSLGVRIQHRWYLFPLSNFVTHVCASFEASPSTLVKANYKKSKANTGRCCHCHMSTLRVLSVRHTSIRDEFPNIDISECRERGLLYQLKRCYSAGIALV